MTILLFRTHVNWLLGEQKLEALSKQVKIKQTKRLAVIKVKTFIRLFSFVFDQFVRTRDDDPQIFISTYGPWYDVNRAVISSYLLQLSVQLKTNRTYQLTLSSPTPFLLRVNRKQTRRGKCVLKTKYASLMSGNRLLRILSFTCAADGGIEFNIFRRQLYFIELNYYSLYAPRLREWNFGFLLSDDGTMVAWQSVIALPHLNFCVTSRIFARYFIGEIVFIGLT